MAILCGICTSSINSRKVNSVFCSECNKQCHSACISKSVEFFELLNSIKGLSWKCDECIDNCIKVNEGEINKKVIEGLISNLIDEKVVNAISTLNTTVECLKNDLSKLSTDELRVYPCTSNSANISANKPKYSDILKNKTNSAVIIQPKNQNQCSSQTKSDLLQKISPTNANIHLSKVVNVKNGGVLISCASNNENEEFKKMVQENLSDSYEIRKVNGTRPRVRIVGFTVNYTEDDLLECIVNCNTSILKNSDCKVIKVFPTKKNKDIFQAVLQLDAVTYEKVTKAGNLFVNYDSCVVFDAIELNRCYRCNEFHHSSKFCSNPVSCPRCGQNHELKVCKAESLTCSNCVKRNEKLDLKVNVNHAAWDTSNCTVYKQACAKIKNDILTGPGQ